MSLACDACVVKRHVEPACLLAYPSEKRCNFFFLRDVNPGNARGAPCLSDCLLGLQEAPLVQVRAIHERPARGEGLSGFATDAGPGASNEDDSIFEVLRNDGSSFHG